MDYLFVALKTMLLRGGVEGLLFLSCRHLVISLVRAEGLLLQKQTQVLHIVHLDLGKKTVRYL